MTSKTIQITFVGALTIVMAPNVAALRLGDLTVPSERLPDACLLSEAPSERIGATFRGGLWAGLNIPTNPWIGADRLLVADIRERMDEQPPVPDLPIVHGSELARYHLKLADGIDEGYAAIYHDHLSEDLVTVYALHSDGTDAVDAYGTRRATPGRKATRLVDGPIVVFISGNAMCFEAILTYVRSLGFR